jgi:hypothetical protein
MNPDTYMIVAVVGVVMAAIYYLLFQGLRDRKADKGTEIPEPNYVITAPECKFEVRDKGGIKFFHVRNAKYCEVVQKGDKLGVFFFVNKNRREYAYTQPQYAEWVNSEVLFSNDINKPIKKQQ